MKPHKHAEFIKAWADGIEVEFSNDDFNGWRDVTEKHHWKNETQYRVKPAAPKWPETTMTNMEINQAIATYDLQLVLFGATEAGRRVANAAIVHACETGQLVTREAHENAIQSRDKQIEALRASTKRQDVRVAELRADRADRDKAIAEAVAHAYQHAKYTIAGTDAVDLAAIIAVVKP